MNMQECTVLHLNAGNDRNGNPRRLFLVLHPERGIVGTADEGYSGTHVLDEIFGKEDGEVLRNRIVGQIMTTVGEYNRLKGFRCVGV